MAPRKHIKNSSLKKSSEPDCSSSKSPSPLIRRRSQRVAQNSMKSKKGMTSRRRIILSDDDEETPAFEVNQAAAHSDEQGNSVSQEFVDAGSDFNENDSVENKSENSLDVDKGLKEVSDTLLNLKEHAAENFVQTEFDSREEQLNRALVVYNGGVLGNIDLNVAVSDDSMEEQVGENVQVNVDQMTEDADSKQSGEQDVADDQEVTATNDRIEEETEKDATEKEVAEESDDNVPIDQMMRRKSNRKRVREEESKRKPVAKKQKRAMKKKVTAGKVKDIKKKKSCEAGSSNPKKKFLNKSSKVKMSFIKGKAFIFERNIKMKNYEETFVPEILQEHKLVKLFSFVKPFAKEVVYEFYSNLNEDVLDSNSKTFHKVYIRGQWIDFSPKVINDFLGTNDEDVDVNLNMNVVVKELTKMDQKIWPESKKIPKAVLSTNYATLFQLVVLNLLPSKHVTSVNEKMAVTLYKLGKFISFNVGKVIFERIMKHANSKDPHTLLPFPSLIFQIIMEQHDVLEEGEPMENPPAERLMSSKLTRGKHVNDIEDPDEDTENRNPGVQSARNAQLLASLENQLAGLDDMMKIIKEKRKNLLQLIHEIRCADNDD